MIVRIVTMTFQPEDVEKFLDIFNQYKIRIKSAEGCSSLELIKNTNFPNEISTLSQWGSQFHLDNYRSSDVFEEVWPMTKKLFSAKPRATSFEILMKV